MNDYMPGQGTTPQVDTHSTFSEISATLSLKSATSIHFKNPQNVTVELQVKPRSLVLLTGEARYNFLHEVPMRKMDKINGMLKFRHRRVSLVFRKLRHTPCSCEWSVLCDSQNKSASVSENMLGGGPAPEALVDIEKN